MSKMLLSFALVSGLLVGDSRAQNIPRDMTTHHLIVRKHEGVVGLTPTDVRNIINRMEQILQNDEDGATGSADVECLVQFTWELGIDFSGPRDINDEDDFEQVVALPGRVKVVDSIQWCEPDEGEALQTEDGEGDGTDQIRGCALKPGGSFVVVSDLPLYAAALVWLHELGHNMALEHLAPVIPHRLMNGRLETVGPRVDQSECDSFR